MNWRESRFMRLRRLFGVMVSVVVLAICSLSSTAAAAVNSYGIRFEQGIFSINVDGVPLNEFLEKVCSLANVEVFIFDGNIRHQLDLETENETIDDVLRHALKGVSYAVVYYHGIYAEEPENHAYRLLRNDGTNTGKAAAAAETIQHAGGKLGGQGAPFQSSITRPDRQQQIRRTSSGYAGGGGPGDASKQITSVERNASDTDRIGGSRVTYFGSEGDTGRITVSDAGGSEDYSYTGEPVGAASATSGDAGPNPAYDKVAFLKDALTDKIAMLEERIASGRSDEWYNTWISIKGGQHVFHDSEHLEVARKRLASLEQQYPN